MIHAGRVVCRAGVIFVSLTRRALDRRTHLPLSPSPLKGGGGTWLRGRGSTSPSEGRKRGISAYSPSPPQGGEGRGEEGWCLSFSFPSGAGRSLRSLGLRAFGAARDRALRAAAQPGPDHARTPRGLRGACVPSPLFRPIPANPGKIFRAPVPPGPRGAGSTHLALSLSRFIRFPQVRGGRARVSSQSVLMSGTELSRSSV